MKQRYGLLGLLSLIGILGILTRNVSLYPFLAFALFFEYLFIAPDEMFVENMRKAAAWAFYAELAVTAAIACCCIAAGQQADAALLKGTGTGFGISLMVFSFSSAWFDWKDRRGFPMIKNRIKEFRARYGMKQEELAARTGVRRETIGNLEKGKYNPSLVLAWHIAKVFHVTIEEIFTVED